LVGSAKGIEGVNPVPGDLVDGRLTYAPIKERPTSDQETSKIRSKMKD
jgi:hypothetical protein